MSWVCPDASLVVRLLTGGSRSRAAGLWGDWLDRGLDPAAPTLLPYELANALWRYVVAGHMSYQEMRDLLAQGLSLGIVLMGDPELSLQAAETARLLGLPALYDAHYLALAQRLGADLWTSDKRLAARAPQVRLLED